MVNDDQFERVWDLIPEVSTFVFLCMTIAVMVMVIFFVINVTVGDYLTKKRIIRQRAEKKALEAAEKSADEEPHLDVYA